MRTWLAHYGTKGMRWGFRRYQNEDGSLTPLGRDRYSTDSGTNTLTTMLSGRGISSYRYQPAMPFKKDSHSVRQQFDALKSSRAERKRIARLTDMANKINRAAVKSAKSGDIARARALVGMEYVARSHARHSAENIDGALRDAGMNFIRNRQDFRTADDWLRRAEGRASSDFYNLRSEDEKRRSSMVSW